MRDNWFSFEEASPPPGCVYVVYNPDAGQVVGNVATFGPDEGFLFWRRFAHLPEVPKRRGPKPSLTKTQPEDETSAVEAILVERFRAIKVTPGKQYLMFELFGLVDGHSLGIMPTQGKVLGRAAKSAGFVMRHKSTGNRWFKVHSTTPPKATQ